MAGQDPLLLTHLLTRLPETGETRPVTRDAHHLSVQVMETHGHARDVENVRITAHNPATTRALWPKRSPAAPLPILGRFQTGFDHLTCRRQTKCLLGRSQIIVDKAGWSPACGKTLQ
jgi:hypothetical protein